jgi:CheY-like chemotaxis protein
MDVSYEEIRSLNLGKTPPIIAVTAGAEKKRKKCIKIGMNDYISKPIARGIIEHLLNG